MMMAVLMIVVFTCIYRYMFFFVPRFFLFVCLRSGSSDWRYFRYFFLRLLQFGIFFCGYCNSVFFFAVTAILHLSKPNKFRVG
jgi:hypothetical protein